MNITHTQNGYGFKGKDFVMFPNAGVPIDYSEGVADGTGSGFAGKGSICIDVTNGELYINKGTKTEPTWKKVTTAA